MKKIVLLAFVLLFFSSSTLIPISRATNIVTDGEQVVYLENRILCEFKVKTIVETEEEETWRISHSEGENMYDIVFVITVTYICPELVEEGQLYPQLRVHFHSPRSGSQVLDEEVVTNSSWFDSEFQSIPNRLFVNAGSRYATRIRLEPYFEYNVYHYNLSKVHLAGGYWRGEPIYIDVTQTIKDVQTEIDSLRTELNTIRNLMYAFITTTIIFIATTAYLAIRKPKVKSEVKTT